METDFTSYLCLGETDMECHINYAAILVLKITNLKVAPPKVVLPPFLLEGDLFSHV